jgi:uncharacterized protein (DUF433 family)
MATPALARDFKEFLKSLNSNNFEAVSTYSILLATASLPAGRRPCSRHLRPPETLTGDRAPARQMYQNGGMQPFDRITWNPNQMNGQPCIRGMRLTVRRVLEAVALYPNRDDLFRNYPELEPDDIQQALAFAAANLEDSAAESNAA